MTVARPKKPEDPVAHPVPCARCGSHYQVGAFWPDGAVCTYCYRAAIRTQGTCACGHVGVLPGRIDGSPACRTCSGVFVNVDCAGCGAEDEIYRHQLCLRCALAQHVDDAFTNPRTGSVDVAWQPIVQALKSMNRANSGLVWIRQAHVQDFLRSMVANDDATHAALDELPAGATRNHMRQLLVEHGVLPVRDELIATFESWSSDALDRLHSPAHRDVIDRYIRWKHLRTMRARSPIAHGTFLVAKQSTTVAIEWCNWLDAQGTDLGRAGQGDLDRWISEGPSTRLMVERFLSWARPARLCSSTLTVPRHRRGTATRLSTAGQADALNAALYSGALGARDRLAVVLVLVFGQQMTSIVQLRWEQVTITDTVTITLAGLPIHLPPPLDQVVRDVLHEPAHKQTATHSNSPWVFLGGRAGTHLQPGYLRNRLRPVMSTLSARLGSLGDLSRHTPAAILAETLGYRPETLEAHASAVADNYARYVAALDQQAASGTLF
jgi:hypothetical protein